MVEKSELKMEHGKRRRLKKKFGLVSSSTKKCMGTEKVSQTLLKREKNPLIY